MFPRLKRLWCRLRGCKPPTCVFDPRNRMIVYCPRCLHVKAGEEVARELGLVRKE